MYNAAACITAVCSSVGTLHSIKRGQLMQQCDIYLHWSHGIITATTELHGSVISCMHTGTAGDKDDVDV